MIDFNDLIGKPYTVEHDCNWLGATVTQRLGTHFPAVASPQTSEQRVAAFQANLAQYGRPVKQPSPGCVAIFKVPQGDGIWAWHCGIVLDNRRMITTTRRLGVHIVKMDASNRVWRRAWRLYLQGYYEVRLDNGQGGAV